MEFRSEITRLLKEGKDWTQIAEEVELNEQELASLARAMTSYASSDTPLYRQGERVCYFEDELTYGFGKIAEVLEKKGDMFPEFCYRIVWDDGFEEIVWEQEAKDLVEDVSRYSWLL